MTLPDIGRWLLWGAVAAGVIGIAWFVWLVKQSKKGGKG